MMETPTRSRKWIICGLILGWLSTFLLLAVVFKGRQWLTAAENNALAARDTISYLSNADSTKTASIRAYELSDRQMRRTLFERDATIARFAKVTAATRITAVARLDSAKARFDTPLLTPAVEAQLSQPIVRTGTIGKDWFSSQYIVDNTGISLGAVTGTVSVTTVTGFKRKWIFGRLYAATDVTPTSPNVTITTITSATVPVPASWTGRVAGFLAGVATGWAVNQTSK